MDVLRASMPRRKPAAACYRCYEQRIECGQRDPSCRNCEKAGVQCVCSATEERPTPTRRVEEQRVVLQIGIDQTGPGVGVTNTVQDRRSSMASANLAVNHGNAAMRSFWSNFAVVDPGHESHGLFDIVREGYTTWSVDSPAALATETIALELFSMTYAGQLTESTTRHVQGRALKSIKGALSKDATALYDGTLLAALLLHFHANVSSYKNLSEGSVDHLDGARALASSRGQHNFISTTSRRLLQIIRSHLISSAIRTGERLELDPAIWNSTLEDFRPKPVELDQLGLEIAGLRVDYMETMQLGTNIAAAERRINRTMANTLLTKAVTFDLHLKTWEARLTPDWFPVSAITLDMNAGPTSNLRWKDHETGTCDSYPSIEAANTMNRYRVYRLICLQIMWSCHLAQDHGGKRKRYGVRQQCSLNALTDSDVVTYQIQTLTNHICNSVAFHLGNDRVAPNGLTTASSTFSTCSPLQSTNETSRVPISRGSWYILGPLSFLVQSFSTQPDQSIQPPPLQEGQLEWIKTSLLRIMRMHGVIGDLEVLDDDHIRRLRESLQYTLGV